MARPEGGQRVLRLARLLGIAMLVALAGLAASGTGAEAIPEYQLKAEFLERFTRFIEWPRAPRAESAAPFMIGVYGKSPFGRFLDELAARRRIKDRAVSIRLVVRIEEVDACDVLFIPPSEAGVLPRILARTAGRPILTVADSPGFAEQGVIINFFTEQDRLRFEINEGAARASGLKVGSQLLQVARLVRAEARR